MLGCPPRGDLPSSKHCRPRESLESLLFENSSRCDELECLQTEVKSYKGEVRISTFSYLLKRVRMDVGKV